MAVPAKAWAVENGSTRITSSIFGWAGAAGGGYSGRYCFTT